MYEDPIVEEVRRIKEQMAAKYNYDVRALGRALREEQKKSGRKVVSLPPKRIAPGTPKE